MIKRKILVVDDDRKIVGLVRLYLEKDGYWVLVAYDGLEALDLARQKRPDLVLLDLMLPGMDGLDVCRILQTESGVPIIMLTARTTDEDKLVGLGLGADDYIQVTTRTFQGYEDRRGMMRDRRFQGFLAGYYVRHRDWAGVQLEG